MSKRSLQSLFDRLKRFAPYWFAWAVVLIPLLRWYGPPQPVWSVKLHREERIAKMSRDGSLIVTTEGYSRRLWDSGSGKPISKGISSAEKLAFSDDCRHFAKIERPTEKEWTLVIGESTTGTTLHRIALAAHLISEEARRRHRLDEVSSFSALWSLREIMFLPDDSSLAVTGWRRAALAGRDQQSTLLVFDLASGRLLHQHSGDYHSRLTVTRSQDERLLLRAVNEPTQPKGRADFSHWELVDSVSNRIVGILTPTCSTAMNAEFLDQDRVIVGGSQGVSRELIGLDQHATDCLSVHLWDASTGLEVARFDGETLVSVSPDRASFVTSQTVKQGASNSYQFRLRDAISGTVQREWNSHRENQNQNMGESGLYVSQDRLYRGPDQAPLTSAEWWSRSWWRWLWPWPHQTSVRAKNSDRIVRAACGSGGRLTPDGRLVVLQTLEEVPSPKHSTPQKWRWTMSAYLVDAAMPWTTALWMGSLLAFLPSWLSRRFLARKAASATVATSGSQPVAQRPCPACGKLTPERLPKCYHCGANSREVTP